jgi:calcium/calmodulin-dependent protein kinase I
MMMLIMIMMVIIMLMIVDGHDDVDDNNDDGHDYVDDDVDDYEYNDDDDNVFVGCYWSLAVFYLAEAINAVEHMHRHGIVHRDIKPENLLFSSKNLETGIIKVSDFGLARLLTADQLATTTCGTPGYVAPEIISEKPYNEACDFWSVGVVLFILLSGEPPFYHEDNFELFELIKKCKYDLNKPAWKNISDEAKDFI